MKRQTRALPVVLAAFCLALAMLAPVAGAAEVVIHYTKEAYPEFEKQLNSGQVAGVTFNKRIRSMRVTLKDGRHVLTVYPPHESATQIAKVEARHVPVTILSTTQATAEMPKKPAHHKLRYIAGGILIVVVLVVGGVLLFRRSQREAD